MSATDVLSRLVLEDGRRWGEAAEDWQWADAEAILERRRRRFYLTRPRGGSKTTDIGAITIEALLDQLPPNARGYVCAVDRDQGALLVEAIEGFRDRDDTGELAERLKIDSWVVRNLETRASIEVLASDAAGAWGKRPHWIVFEELAQWPETATHTKLFRAMFTSAGKVPDSRMIVITTAGDPASEAFKLLEHARQSPEWYVNEVPGPCPWISEADLAEDRARIPEWEVARLHGNVWTASRDRLVRVDDLAACVGFDGDRHPHSSVGRYVMGLDLGITQDRAALVVAHPEPVRRRHEKTPLGPDDPFGWHRMQRAKHGPKWDQRIVVDYVKVWEPSKTQPVSLTAVEDHVLRTSRAYEGAGLWFDPYQAIRMAEAFQAAGVATHEVAFNQRTNSERALVLHQLIRERRLVLPDDRELLDELAHVRLIETNPGVYRIDHDRDRHDDRAIALSIVAEVLHKEAMTYGRGGVSMIRDRRLHGTR